MRTDLALLLASLVFACERPSAGPLVQPAPSSTVPSSTSVAAATAQSSAARPVPRPGGKLRVIEAPGDVDAASLIRTERLRAKAEGKALVVYVGASWCEPCRKFHELTKSGSIDAELGDITLLHFDANRDEDRLAAAGYRYKFIPFFALAGADGSMTAQYETKGDASTDTMRAIVRTLAAWQPGR